MDWVKTFIHLFNALYDFVDEMLGIKPDYYTDSDPESGLDI
jgi:hypothetical protein